MVKLIRLLSQHVCGFEDTIEKELMLKQISISAVVLVLFFTYFSDLFYKLASIM